MKKNTDKFLSRHIHNLDGTFSVTFVGYVILFSKFLHNPYKNSFQFNDNVYVEILQIFFRKQKHLILSMNFEQIAIEFSFASIRFKLYT